MSTERRTTRSDLIGRLDSLPVLLRGAEQDLLTATARLTAAKRDLDCREADLILGLGVDLGKNDLERKARLLIGTLSFQETVTEAQEEQARCALEVRCLGFELRALETTSRLLCRTGEED